jgi:hypothetical protein
MFAEGVLASAMALLSQFFAASAADLGFAKAGRGCAVLSAGFGAGLDAPAGAKIQKCIAVSSLVIQCSMCLSSWSFPLVVTALTSDYSMNDY